MVRDMTKGSPAKQICAMALPLLLGNVFQASYNLVDTFIIGRYAGMHALAGVGIASPVFNLLNALLMGLSVGASILIGQLFGAKREEELPKAVSTVLWIAAIAALVITGIGEVVVHPFLSILKAPAEDFAYAAVYLRVILAGLICNAFYNQLTGLLRGVGNTKVPLYILIFSCCANGGMDFIFVYLFHWGVTGAALATVIAEGLSAVGTYLYILKAVPMLKPELSVGIDKEMSQTVIRFGLPMGLQQASISFGHVLMQGIIDPFGSALIAGYAAAAKVDMFAVMPIIALGSAMSAFSAQNSGAGDYERVKKGYLTGITLTIVICAGLAFLVFPLRTFWVGLFVSAREDATLAADIILMGSSMLAVTPLFYWVLGLIHAALNTMAGAGATKVSMYAMIGMMLLRVAIAWAFIHIGGASYTAIWWAFVLSWAITLVCTQCYYFTGKWKKKGIRK